MLEARRGWPLQLEKCFLSPVGMAWLASSPPGAKSLGLTLSSRAAGWELANPHVCMHRLALFWAEPAC